MEWLNVKSHDELVEIIHTNGRLMPGHQPTPPVSKGRAVIDWSQMSRC
jgi:hypothetical protein